MLHGGMSERIGILGGSFNPVHTGHLILAQDALEQFGLHRVFFVPAAQPPHKPSPTLASCEDRLEMLRLAVDDDPRFDVSDLELRRGGVSYTVDTLRRLREECPGASLFFIIGGDTLRELHTWKDIYTVLSLCEIITVARPGFRVDDLDAASLRLDDPWPRKLAANVATGHLVEISATDIRARVARGHSIRYLVPAAVATYIQRRNIYGNQETSRSTH